MSQPDTYEVQVGLPFMGDDFIADVTYRVTSWGETGTWSAFLISPPDPLEWEIDEIILSREVWDSATKRWTLGPAFRATGALFHQLADRDRIFNEVNEAAYAERSDRTERRYVD